MITRSRTLLGQFAVILCAALVLQFSAFAQSTAGVQGTVTDATGAVVPRGETGELLLKSGAVVRPQLRQFVRDLFGDALPVFRVEPVVWVAERMDVSHG